MASCSGFLTPWLLLVAVCRSVSAQAAPPTMSLLDPPQVRIGGSESGSPETLFAGIVAVVRLSNGDIAIADGGNHVVRVFAADGEYLRSFGREGSGPGEFRGLWWLGSCPDGNLVAIDAIQSRAGFLTPDARRLLRTINLPQWLLFNKYLACESDDRLVALLHQPGALGEKGEVTRFPASVARFRYGALEPATVFSIAGTEYYFATNVGGFSPLPLGATAVAAANGGFVFAGNTKEPEVRWFHLSTGRNGVIEHGLPQAPVTASSWARAQEEVIEGMPLARTKRLVRDVLREAPKPTHDPYFTDIAVDSRGRLWMRLPASAEAATWRIVDHNGRHLASVVLPESYRPVDIGEEYLIGIERSALGVQSVVVHRLSQPIVGEG